MDEAFVFFSCSSPQPFVLVSLIKVGSSDKMVLEGSLPSGMTLGSTLSFKSDQFSSWISKSPKRSWFVLLILPPDAAASCSVLRTKDPLSNKENLMGL